MVFRWLREHEVLAMHGELIAGHGGSDGVRDPGLLDSALARPLQKAAYDDPSVFDCAAAYAFGIIRNHPFIDGNKRTGFVAAAVFMKLNGWDLTAAEAEAYSAIITLAQGELDESGITNWLRANSTRRARSGGRRSV
ncbi:MAG: type II toxin-antitoxin system death-on-curing family toxin [Alphaproteobacteria bacterium]|nr:type II toxin-antitoxin system death-on-curing family toxin [Alphaproteobacteria bacterium]